MCGLLFVVFWYFRLAFLANFLSRAVLVGFISGLGIEVLTNQVRKILAASRGKRSGGRWELPARSGTPSTVRWTPRAISWRCWTS